MTKEQPYLFTYKTVFLLSSTHCTYTGIPLHYYLLDETICHLKDVGSILLFLAWAWLAKANAIVVIPRINSINGWLVGCFGFNGWLVGCFGFNGPLRQYFSLYRAVSQREGERKEK